MTLLALALAVLSAATALHARRQAERARRCVEEEAGLMARAERVWALRHRSAVAWEDEAGATVSERTQIEIVQARMRLEEDRWA